MIGCRIFLAALFSVVMQSFIRYFDGMGELFWAVVVLIEIMLAYNTEFTLKDMVSSLLLGFFIDIVIQLFSAYDQYSYVAACTVLLLLSISILIIRHFLIRISKKEELYIKTYRGEAVVKMFSDSGNLLKDKNSGRQVIILRAEDAVNIAPLSALFALGLSNEQDNVKIYPISYKTLGGGGVLYGFKPQKCIIKGREVECIIALCSACERFAGDCSALCNPYILEA